MLLVVDIVNKTFFFIALVLLLSVVCITTPELPAEENVGQWVWLGKALLLSGSCILIAVLLQLMVKNSRKHVLWFSGFSVYVSWGILFCGAVEAIWGLRQLYGFAASGHSRYALTGSFFNPGPYAGYLAMVLPLCLHLYLCTYKEKTVIRNLKRGIAAIIGILILCVLPATMSRSAWIAAVMGCGWVSYMHRDRRRWRILWKRYRKRYVLWSMGVLFIVALGGGGAFILKPDSVLGRLFMWKITCQAIMNHPWGSDKGFVSAYGEAQENYFAQGNYAEWEERVAGSPEYAFNEYLSLALMEGIIVCVVVLVIIGICLWMGVKRGRYGICGAILSLLVFSFSSYPMHFPAFVVAGLGLLLACGVGDIIGKPLVLCICLIVWAGGCMEKWQQTENACQKWTYARMFYHSGAYKAANEAYGKLYSILKDRGAFLFEYGHSLHKSFLYSESNKYLKEACKHSVDPMILNVMGKNYQEQHCYEQAENFFYRAIHRLPGRIYPYYLLAKLYAEPDFYKPDKLKEVADSVLTKEPKVHSTAIDEMRSEVREILEKIKVK